MEMGDREVTFVSEGAASDAGAAWSVWLRGSTQFWRAAPRGGSLTFQGGGLALSGEAELGMNWGVVDSSERDGVLLRQLIADLGSRRLPAYLLLSSAVAPAHPPATTRHARSCRLIT